MATAPHQGEPGVHLSAGFQRTLACHGLAQLELLEAFKTDIVGRLGRHEWSWDADSQRLRLVGGSPARMEIQLRCQLLATKSHVSNTWRWCWRDAASYPDGALEMVNRLRAEGKRLQMPELESAQLPLADGILDGHALLLASMAILNEGHSLQTAPVRGCYEGDYGQGCVYLLVVDSDVRFRDEPDTARDALHLFTLCRNVLPQVDAREVLRSYVHRKKTSVSLRVVSERESMLTFQGSSPTLIVVINDQHRLERIEVWSGP